MFANIFDSKVVNHERKTYVQCIVLPEGGSARDRSITKICEICSEAFIGNAAVLFDTRHVLYDF